MRMNHIAGAGGAAGARVPGRGRAPAAPNSRGAAPAPCTALRAGRRTSRPILSTLLASALLVPVTLAAQERRPLTPEQVVELREVRSAELSPDGRLTAYTVSVPRPEADGPGGAYTELHVVPAAGGEPRAVVRAPHSAGAASWSPDGAWLAFLARLPGHDQTQVWAVPADRLAGAGAGDAELAGQARRLTSSPANVSNFAWAPDGRAIAYTAPEPADPAAAERRARGWDQIVASEQGRWSRLWVQPLDGTPRRVMPDDRHVLSFAWAPDGSALAVQATDRPETDAEYMFRRIYLAPVAGSGEPRLLARTEGKLGAMAWAPDGSKLAFLGATSFNDPLAQSVFVVDAAAAGQGPAEPRNLTPDYEGSAVWVGWLDAGTVAFVADEGTKTALNRVPAAGGRIQRVAGGGGEVFGSVSFDAKRQAFATAASTASHPAEAFVGSVKGGALRRLTEHNPWLAGAALGRQQTIEWQGADGWRIQGVVIYPVGYREGTRYPLAILPHGGPEGVSLDGWSTRALYPAQVLAGRGYVVLMPNYRGSGGRGVAFSKADHRDLGGKEFDDVLAGIDHLAAAGVVDPERVGISGTSYGGYFSAWAATRHSHRFKAAIPFAGLTNWISFTLTTDIPVEMSAVHWDLEWHENAGLFWERSPVAHIDRASTPTLVATGLADDRVHPEQALELYTALKLKGVPTDLVRYPREPHGLRERAHQLDFMRRIVDWLDRYVKEGKPVS